MNQESNEAMLTTPQVADRLGVSTARVRQFISEGRLPSRQHGRDHLIKESDLALVANRKWGRPSKNQADASGELSTATDAPDDGALGTAVRNEEPANPAKKVRKKG